MELKHIWRNTQAVGTLGLNCTVMELKLIELNFFYFFVECLNCTVMELKLIYSYRLILRSGS